MSFWNDCLNALRSLRKNPVFAATAILTLALGIGGNTAMFTVIRTVLLKPLDYPNPDQLVKLEGGATPTRFQFISEDARSFSGIGAYTGIENLTLTKGAEPEVIHGARVSADFLSVLERKPILGLGFQSSDDLPGSEPVVLISQELWTRRFNQSPSAIGHTITLSEIPYRVKGILPPRFSFPYAGVDVWMPRPSEWPLMPEKSRRMSPFLTLFGRLKTDVNLQQANAELAVVRSRYATQNPIMLDAKLSSPVELKRMRDELVTDVSTMLWMLFGAVAFVLLITCANVASLMLARAKSRSREFAVRSAVGASWSNLVTNLLAESLLLSLAGGALGVLLALFSLRAIPLITSFDLPRTGEIEMDWMVLLFAAALSIATGVAFGLAPALVMARPNLIGVLRASGLAASEARKFNPRNFLVVGQVAFSVVLLIGAALMIESVVHLRDVNLGFNTRNLFTAQISLPPAHYDTDQKQTQFFQSLVDKVGSVPGISSATIAMTLPMGGNAGTPVQDANKPPLKLNERLIATVCVTTPGYFRTLQIPMRRGRDFNMEDKKDSERVAIVDEALARRFWPQYPKGVDPVGQHLLIGYSNPHPARIIGIAQTIHQNLENSEWPQTLYVAFAQAPSPASLLAARTIGDPHHIASSVQKAVQILDRDVPLTDVHSMDDLVDITLGQRRLVVDLLSAFAVLSLLLAVIGIYGTISYSVTQRVQEIAIRSALGAQKHDILRLVLSQGFVLAIIGIGLGTTGSYWLTQALKKLLFAVSATDPLTFLCIGLLFMCAALIASYLPARRASLIDPLEALRQ